MNPSVHASPQTTEPVMFCGMKYVVIGKPGDSEESFVVFPSSLSHAEVAGPFGVEHVVSAGFVCVAADGRFACFGESFTLGIESRPARDAELLNRQNFVVRR